MHGLLQLGAGLPAPDALLVTVLLAGLPALALAQLPLAAPARVLDRIPAYVSSIFALLLIGGASWLVGTRSGGAGVGLEPLAPGPLLLWTLGLTAGGFAVTLAFRALTLRLGRSDPPLLHLLLPRTGSEKAVFAVLSVSAGVGEELAYRGYLILALAPVTGLAGSVVLSTVVFGIIHAYQGTIGIARTGALGGLLAWGFLAAGSLWPPILAHTLIDLLAGLVFAERLVVRPPEA
mgnify:CR=1 FL=1